MIELFISAFLKGGMYILIAMGLSLVYGVMKIPNFAHGEFYLIGAYCSYIGLSMLKLPGVVVIALAAVMGFVFGAIIERLTFNPLRKRSKSDWSLNTFLVTAGISFVIQNVAQMIFTAEFWGVEKIWQGSLNIAGINIPTDRVISFVIAIAVVIIFWAFLKKTRTGNAITAVSENEEGAMLMGVQINSIHTLTFALSSMLAAIAGAALISITPAYPTMGLKPLYSAWFVVILVGLGNLEATIVGAFIVSFIEVFATYYVGAAWADAVSLSVIVVILLIKPTGLFGKRVKV
ncbi:branched-chain amino acid ABC transporter permease [Ruminococcus gauvreauii]|uniref:Branched-chain amino acid ABC transporter permease n=1 Tax=Ruminococcus gauvreauii TaxID=438033 RepID=A0ABY5VDM5_9FIRM|nr:branched-chain amino acid ABC transporter permease [Ruminococcus gauvreauii]UWP58459.1 branched-chain amino acid ABC transporter permease [Ruminococcus gauvreauii]